MQHRRRRLRPASTCERGDRDLRDRDDGVLAGARDDAQDRREAVAAVVDVAQRHRRAASSGRTGVAETAGMLVARNAGDHDVVGSPSKAAHEPFVSEPMSVVELAVDTTWSPVPDPRPTSASIVAVRDERREPRGPRDVERPRRGEVEGPRHRSSGSVRGGTVAARRRCSRITSVRWSPARPAPASRSVGRRSVEVAGPMPGTRDLGEAHPARAREVGVRPGHVLDRDGERARAARREADRLAVGARRRPEVGRHGRAVREREPHLGDPAGAHAELGLAGA